jgi:carotenoid cleavage dioxygenase-like enzyme
MMKFAVVLGSLTIGASSAFDDSGYLTWFDDEHDEAHDVPLHFEGNVPDYVRGTFVQGGPGLFSMGGMKVGHAFDGFSKINRLHFGDDGGVTFTSWFLNSSFLSASAKANRIAPGIVLGITDPPNHPSALGHNDNNYIKSHKIGSTEVILSDTMVATVLSEDFTHFDYSIRPKIMSLANPGKAWEDHFSPSAHICMLGVMAHGHTDPDTGIFTGVMGCNSPVGSVMHDYHIVFTIDPATPRHRQPLATIELPRGRGASYMHAMGVTANYVVLIAEPLHMSIPGVLAGKPLAEGGLVIGNGTLFQLVNRYTGSVRTFQAPGFFLAHVVNTWEEHEDVVLDVTWYEADEHMSFFRQFLFKNQVNKTIRDTWPKNKMMRFRLRADGAVEQSELFKDEPDTQFELPKINEMLKGQKHCIMYAFQPHSYAYDANQSSRTSGPFGACGVAKRNLCTGHQSGFYASNHYPSEVEFIPDPNGHAEDDGVLVGIVYNATGRSSYVNILDAQTMRTVARAKLPFRLPFLIHSSFFPTKGDNMAISYV